MNNNCFLTDEDVRDQNVLLALKLLLCVSSTLLYYQFTCQGSSDAEAARSGLQTSMYVWIESTVSWTSVSAVWQL